MKTDLRDAIRLARKVRGQKLPEAYVPPLEHDAVRDLVRLRQRLGRRVTSVRLRVHVLVDWNLLNEKMRQRSDWFRVTDLDALVVLPIPDQSRAFLQPYLRQLAQIVWEEECEEGEMAPLVKGSHAVEFLRTSPGFDFHSALAM